MLDLDLAINDQLTAPNIDVVAAAAGIVCASDSSSVGPEIQLETCFPEAVEGFFFGFCKTLSTVDAEG